MAPKTVYLACAEEDMLFRNVFTAQWSRAGASARFVEPPARTASAAQWKEDVRAGIRRSDGVIALIGGYTETSEHALWPIRCAAAEGKPLLGLWLSSEHRVKPAGMDRGRCLGWTWENVGDFLDAL